AESFAIFCRSEKLRAFYCGASIYKSRKIPEMQVTGDREQETRLPKSPKVPKVPKLKIKSERQKHSTHEGCEGHRGRTKSQKPPYLHSTNSFVLAHVSGSILGKTQSRASIAVSSAILSAGIWRVASKRRQMSSRVRSCVRWVLKRFSA